jgi:hypothetical protein
LTDRRQRSQGIAQPFHNDWCQRRPTILVENLQAAEIAAVVLKSISPAV